MQYALYFFDIPFKYALAMGLSPFIYSEDNTAILSYNLLSHFPKLFAKRLILKTIAIAINCMIHRHLCLLNVGNQKVVSRTLRKLVCGL